MTTELPSLGELEVRVLRLVWQHQPCTERQVTDRIQEAHPVARTTVLKTIQRLEAKGLLERLPEESPVRFRAAVDEKRVLPTLVQRFVDRILGGSPDALVAYLADSDKLSTDDLQTLQDIAQKVARETRTREDKP